MDSGTDKKKKTPSEERLEKLELKISQLKAQKQALEARAREAERKARTRRLIQNGALAEKYLGCEGMQPEEFEAFLAALAGRLAGLSES